MKPVTQNSPLYRATTDCSASVNLSLELSSSAIQPSTHGINPEIFDYENSVWVCIYIQISCEVPFASELAWG